MWAPYMHASQEALSAPAITPLPHHRGTSWETLQLLRVRRVPHPTVSGKNTLHPGRQLFAHASTLHTEGGMTVWVTWVGRSPDVIHKPRGHARSGGWAWG